MDVRPVFHAIMSIHCPFPHNTTASFPLRHITTLTVSPAYHLDNVDCGGNERMLSDCKHRGIGVHDCSPGKEAGVTCNGESCFQFFLVSFGFQCKLTFRNFVSRQGMH